MGQYSIKELEKLSGIKAHTIRIWEKRYGVIEPQRTSTNIRYYSDDDLKKIINVSLLNSHGLKISVIANMSGDELTRKVQDLSQTNHASNIHIDQLVTAMIDLDEEEFEHELKMIEKKLGFEKTVIEIIYPFLNKIGILWQTGNITPAHEHFISNLIRQKLIVAIAALPLPAKSSIRVLLFLPETELHEIALLFYHYLARRYGFKTYYLGQSVPHNDLKAVYAIHKPHFLITSLTSVPAPKDLNDYLKKLSGDFPASRILASGSLLRNASFKHPQNLNFFETALELKTILTELK
ncbi:MAG TPA: MerR family transcriptional regulator [Cyclobacteriaceae bacterium]|nr:MerR family transcriptional regulator [Cyclobacteriaceae bacterium]